jgi:hypothetical protein
LTLALLIRVSFSVALGLSDLEKQAESEKLNPMAELRQAESLWNPATP